MHGGKREMWRSWCVTVFLAFLPLCVCNLSSPPFFEEEAPCCFSILSRFSYRHTGTRCHTDSTWKFWRKKVKYRETSLLISCSLSWDELLCESKTVIFLPAAPAKSRIANTYCIICILKGLGSPRNWIHQGQHIFYFMMCSCCPHA